MMAEPSEQGRPCPRCAKLEQRVAELEARLLEMQARYEAYVTKLEARVRELEGLLLEATRAAKRQAAPFSRNRPQIHPKKPGRPVGHPAAHRPTPPPAEIAVDKQKCLGHLLKDLSAVEALKSRGAVRFSRAAGDVLRDAMALKRRRNQWSEAGYAIACGKIEARTDRLLAGRYIDPENRRLAQRMIKHREHLFTFLYHQAVEPTNNAAERALRPAVISRKLSAGNRSPTGALAHSILASLCQTARQNGQNFLCAARLLLQHRDSNYIAPVLPEWAPACALSGR
jgi:hypothetical protein